MSKKILIAALAMISSRAFSLDLDGILKKGIQDEIARNPEARKELEESGIDPDSVESLDDIFAAVSKEKSSKTEKSKEKKKSKKESKEKKSKKESKEKKSKKESKPSKELEKVNKELEKALKENKKDLKKIGIDVEGVKSIAGLVRAIKGNKMDIGSKLREALKGKKEELAKIGINLDKVNDISDFISQLIDGVMKRVHEELENSDKKITLREKLEKELSTKKSQGDLKKLNLSKKELLELEPEEALRRIIKRAIKIKMEESMQKHMDEGASKKEAKMAALKDVIKDL